LKIDDFSFERIVNVPKRSIGDTSVKLIHEYAKINLLSLETSSRYLVENNKIKPKTKIGLSVLLNLIEKWRNDLNVKKIGHIKLLQTILDESGYSQMLKNKKSIEEKGEKGLEEERRLAYVGITRAKKLANISFSMNRFYQGDWIDSLSSRFIDELPEGHIKKNNFYSEESSVEFEFNQDIEFENETRSPGWLRYQKKLRND
jgi:superfamily I DNA/RNA helicase